MKNNKGFTVFELLIGFIFLIMISYFLLTTILTIRENQQLTTIKNQMIDIKANLTREINNDLLKHYLSTIVSCGETCIDINFSDGITKRLNVDTINNKIIYGDSEYQLIEDSYFDSPFIMDITTIDDSFGERDNSIFKIIIPIKHYDLKGDYGIEITNSFNIHGPIFAEKGAPKIILNGENPMYVALNGTYNEPGATATDDNNNDISNNIQVSSTIRTNIEGTYTVLYKVTDNKGNTSSEIRIVNVIEAVTNFAFTGTVQNFVAPRNGTYKLEVWGAQGGDYSSYTGGKGGYSVGEIYLTEGTELFVYVGGRGTNYSSGYINGGWNGGGGAYGRSYYCTCCDDTCVEECCGYSYKSAGGGATDISLIKSDLTYTNYRTVKSDASLLARIIVAGGGSGCGSSGSGYGGGGTEGLGYSSTYYGKQDSAGSGGGFGFGANAMASNWKYASPAGGGGWYGGGGGSNSDSYTTYRRYVGSGSGYVLTELSYKPAGYTPTSNYWMTNTNTIAGNASMPAPDGTSQIGQADNGYARITWIQ